MAIVCPVPAVELGSLYADCRSAGPYPDGVAAAARRLCIEAEISVRTIALQLAPDAIAEQECLKWPFAAPAVGFADAAAIGVANRAKAVRVEIPNAAIPCERDTGPPPGLSTAIVGGSRLGCRNTRSCQPKRR